MKIRGFLGSIFDFIKKNVGFIILMLCVFVALALVVGLTFGMFYSNAKKNAVTIGNMTVRDEARRIDDILAQGLNTVQMTGLSVDYMIKHGVDVYEIEKFLVEETERTQSEIDESFTSVYGVIDDIYIDGNSWVPDDGYDPYQRPWYKAAAANKRKPTIVSPYIDAQTGHRMISFSQILSGGKNALSLDKEIDDIYNAAKEIQLFGNGYCFVVDSSGVVVSHRTDSEKDKNYLADDSVYRSLIRRIFEANNQETEITLNGEECLVFSATMQDDWHIVLVVEREDVFSDIRTSLMRSILISLVIFIIVGYFCTSNYINRKKAVRYANEVRTDNLTGLNNRGEFDRFISATTGGIPESKKLYLMLFDADNFKGINDAYGHLEGDRALKHIAGVLDKVAEKYDSFCARYGGDEFVIVCNCQNDDEVQAIADEVDKELHDTAVQKKLPYDLVVSVGYAAYESEMQTVAELIDNADLALYKEKRRKKNSANI